MTDPENDADETPEIADSDLLAQLRMMAGALWASPVRGILLTLSGAVFIVIAATAYGQIRLNNWNQPFYDALSHRNMGQFKHQLGVFGIIAGTLLILNVAQRWLGETLKWRLRQGLVHDLIQNWLVPGRAFRLGNAGAIGVNPDQRMHEDARHLTDLTTDLGLGLLQSSILLASFVEVLWNLSSTYAFHINGKEFVVPGYMVWAAVLYSGSASLVSYWVGRNLIGRNERRYAREADLRFSLVRVNEHIDAVALAGGEADEARRIGVDLAAVLKATARLVTGLTNLAWVTSGYGWITLVAPILVAAPLYFEGELTFGGLMLASGAFLQVQSSLRWFVDNFSTIADWRATLLRVAVFRQAVIDSDVMHDSYSRINYSQGSTPNFVIENLRISAPTGGSMLQESSVQIRPGEKVLIVADSGTGKTTLFRALAGLWPWGSGSVTHPADLEIIYMPRTPYMSPGSLRDILAYPRPAQHFDDAAFVNALTRLGLERLLPQIDAQKRWERELNEDEQQDLAFARVILHQPPWLLIDEVFDSLDDEAMARIAQILTQEMATTGVIHIGRNNTQRLFFRVLHLVKDPRAKILPIPAAAARAAGTSHA